MAQRLGKSGTGEFEHAVLVSEGEHNGGLTPIHSSASHGRFAADASVRVNRSTSFSSNPACAATAVPKGVADTPRTAFSISTGSVSRHIRHADGATCKTCAPGDQPIAMPTSPISRVYSQRRQPHPACEMPTLR